MSEIKNYQVPLNEDTMNELMRKTHTDTQKGALTAAVLFTLEGKTGGK